MNFAEYQEKAKEFAQYDEEAYPFVALSEEVGEFLSYAAKALRGDDFSKRFESEEQFKRAILKEAGDVLWQLSQCLNEWGYSLQEAAEMNIEKLTDRKNRGVIRGSGDNR